MSRQPPGHDGVRRRANDPDESVSYRQRHEVDAQTLILLEQRLGDCEATVRCMLAGQDEICSNLRSIKSSLDAVSEVVQVWGNAKGFWTTLKFISAALALIAALWAFAKTGQWLAKN